jgi:hypothetical protein
VIDPVVVTRPTWINSVNHTAPSGPAVIPDGLSPYGFLYSVIDPAVVMRPI